MTSKDRDSNNFLTCIPEYNRRMLLEPRQTFAQAETGGQTDGTSQYQTQLKPHSHLPSMLLNMLYAYGESKVTIIATNSVTDGTMRRSIVGCINESNIFSK